MYVVLSPLLMAFMASSTNRSSSCWRGPAEALINVMTRSGVVSTVAKIASNFVSTSCTTGPREMST